MNLDPRTTHEPHARVVVNAFKLIAVFIKKARDGFHPFALWFFGMKLLKPLNQIATF